MTFPTSPLEPTSWKSSPRHQLQCKNNVLPMPYGSKSVGTVQTNGIDTVWFSAKHKNKLPPPVSQQWDIVFGMLKPYTCIEFAQDTQGVTSSALCEFTLQIDIYFIFFLSFISPLVLSCVHLYTYTVHRASYTTASVKHKFVAHSGLLGVPGPLKYPPPPTIPAHSNQPLPQL